PAAHSDGFFGRRQAGDGDIQGPGQGFDQIRDGLDVVERDAWQGVRSRNGVAGDGADAGIVGVKPGFVVRLAVDFDLDVRVAFEALDQNEVDRTQGAQQFV